MGQDALIRAERENAVNIVCRFCGVGGFHWERDSEDASLHLVSDNGREGKRHECPERKAYYRELSEVNVRLRLAKGAGETEAKV